MQSYSNIGGVSAFNPSRIEIRSEEAWEMESYPGCGKLCCDERHIEAVDSRGGAGLGFRASAMLTPLPPTLS
jgi:hypothetical protein